MVSLKNEDSDFQLWLYWQATEEALRGAIVEHHLLLREQGTKISEKERFSFVQVGYRFLAHEFRHDHMPIRNHMDCKTLHSLKL